MRLSWARVLKIAFCNAAWTNGSLGCESLAVELEV
jgi:hypothetical protein